MLKIKECKAKARSVLNGRYGTMIAASLLSSLISILLAAAAFGCLIYSAAGSGIFKRFSDHGAAFSFGTLITGVLVFSVLMIISVIIGVLLGMGRQKLLLNVCRGRRYAVSDVFYAFSKGSRPWKYIMSVLILWAIAFVGNLIPNIITNVLELFMGDELAAALIIIVIQIVFSIITAIILITFLFASLILIDKPETGLSEAFGMSARLMKGRKLKGFWLKNFSFLLWYMLGMICPLIMLWITPYYECTMMIFYMDADGSLWQLPGSGRSPVYPQMTQDAETAASETEIEAAAEAAGGEAADVETAETAAAAADPISNAETEVTVEASETVSDEDQEETGESEAADGEMTAAKEAVPEEETKENDQEET